MEGLGGLGAVLLGLLLVGGGVALIVLQLRGRPAGPPGAGWGQRIGRLRSQIGSRAPRPAVSHPAAPPLSTEEERRQRLQELRAQRGPDIVEPIGLTHPAPSSGSGGPGSSPDEPDAPPPWAPPAANDPTVPVPAAGGELVAGAAGLPPGVPRWGGRAPRRPEVWRQAVAGQAMAGQAVPAGGTTLRTIFGAIIVLALVVLAIGLLLRGREPGGAAAPAPGSAILAIADFGEGPSFRPTALGSTTGQSIRLVVVDTLGAADTARMPVVAAGLVANDADAQRALDRGQAQALLWGTLPAGATGPISASLAWRGSPPGAPWLRYGPTGRLLLPHEVPLPNQPIIAVKALAPALAAVQYYQAGEYDQARTRAESVPADAPPSTQNLAAFIRANALIASDRAADALPLYAALEARGWRDPALYNNWGVAAWIGRDYALAGARLQRAADLTPPTDQATLATIATNEGILASDAGNWPAAQAALDRALQLAPDDPEANWRRGYLAYRRGDSATATAYTAKALSAAPDNPAIERQAGLIDLMSRRTDSAIGHFQKALDLYGAWNTTLKGDEAVAVSRGNTLEGSRYANRERDILRESGTTEYYIGLAYADVARSKPPEGFFQSTWRHITGGKNESDLAIQAFSDSTRLDPDHDREDVSYQLGILHRHNGDRQPARDAFAHAKALRPDDPGPYQQLAEMDQEDKKPDAAIAEYQALLAANPNYLPGYQALAALYHQTGNLAAEQQTFTQMVARPATTPQEHLSRARALAGLNRPDEAAAEARTAFTLDPTLWDAHLLLAEIYAAAKQDTAALAEYLAVTKVQPDNVEALYESGRLLAAAGRTDEARKQWQRVESLQPDHPEVHFALGGLYEQRATLAAQQNKPDEARNWTDQALQEYNTAVDKHPERADGYYHLGVLYEGRGAWKEAEARYSEASKKNPDLVEAWQGLVRVLLKQPGRDADALKAAQDFRAHAPADVRANLLLGDVFLYRNDPGAALGQYGQALKLVPGDPRALTGMGRAYHLQGDDGQAAQYYAGALKADPNNAAALTGEGDLYLDQQRYGQAQDAYSRAWQADSSYAPALVGLGRTLDRLNQGPEAIKQLQQAATIDPTAADPHYYLGEIYAERSLWDQAIHEYTTAGTLRPSWALPQFRLGQIYLSQHKLPEALAAYRLAVKLDPNMIEGWFGLGQAARDSGGRKEAIDSYRQAIKLKSDYAAAWLYLGYTLEEDGQRSEAIDAFRHALDSANDDAQIRTAAQEALRRYP